MDRTRGPLEFLTTAFVNYFPYRTYYRLVDEDGNPVKFDKDSSDKFVYLDKDVETYWDGEYDEGWFWRRAIPKKLADAIKNQAKLEDYNGVFVILDEASNVYTESFTRYIPFILEIKGHWYQDISFKGCYEWDTSEESKSNEYIYTAKENDNAAI